MKTWLVSVCTATTSTDTGDCSGRTCPISSAISSRNGWPTSRRRSMLLLSRPSPWHFPFRKIRRLPRVWERRHEQRPKSDPRQREGHRSLPCASGGHENEKERELYRSRIEREERLLEELRGGLLGRFAAWHAPPCRSTGWTLMEARDIPRQSDAALIGRATHRGLRRAGLLERHGPRSSGAGRGRRSRNSLDAHHHSQYVP